MRRIGHGRQRVDANVAGSGGASERFIQGVLLGGKAHGYGLQNVVSQQQSLWVVDSSFALTFAPLHPWTHKPNVCEHSQRSNK